MGIKEDYSRDVDGKSKITLQNRTSFIDYE